MSTAAEAKLRPVVEDHGNLAVDVDAAMALAVFTFGSAEGTDAFYESAIRRYFT